MHVISFGVSLLLVAMTSSEATAGDVRAAGAGPGTSAPVAAAAGPVDASGVNVRDLAVGGGQRPHPGVSDSARTIQFRTGLILFGDPPGPMASRGALGGGRMKVHAKVSAVSWVAPDGTMLSTRFPASVDLSAIDSLIAPEGDWTDVRLTFASDLVIEGSVEGSPLYLELDMHSMTIPLDEPVSSDGAARVGVTLTLPDALLDAAVASDGLDVIPGDAMYSAVLGMVQDAAMAAAR